MEDSAEVEYVLIGAGLPRTGTFSTFTALEKVLPGRCHHMAKVFRDPAPSEQQFWQRAQQGQLTDQDWLEFIRASRLSASVDFPLSLYWRDLARLYPRAKVVLTVRDPVRWFHSVRNTIREVNRLKDSWLGAPLSPQASFTCFAPTYLGPRYPRGMFGAVDAGEETAVRFFTEWQEQVKKDIPADRLLVFEVKDGWEPLCQFLGIPVPQEPFPNANDTAEMQQYIRRMKRTCYLGWGIGIAAAGVAGYYLNLMDHIKKLLS